VTLWACNQLINPAMVADPPLLSSALEMIADDCVRDAVREGWRPTGAPRVRVVHPNEPWKSSGKPFADWPMAYVDVDVERPS
jgi:hypothetical protein